MKRSVPQPVVIGLIVFGFLLAGLGAWFLVVGPQRSKAADLDKQIADTHQAIDAARALTVQAKRGAKIRVADLFRLTKAMPDQTDMAGIVLELNQVAEDSGITFEQITPATTAVALSGYAAIPITVEFQGNFYDLADFLYRLRNLVDVRHGALDATGRLFAIDQIEFAEAPPPPGFPEIRAHLVIDAFVFGTGSVPAAVPPPAAPAAAPATDTTSTSTTTTSTTTPAPSTDASAAAAGP
ncbi:MAG TPA: type 4a pilus biogenesis protein PilO [Gaiellaceae bacterium]